MEVVREVKVVIILRLVKMKVMEEIVMILVKSLRVVSVVKSTVMGITAQNRGKDTLVGEKIK